MRIGRVDKKIELTYCNDEQIFKLFNHYSCSDEKLTNQEFNIQITPAKLVDIILCDINMPPSDFKPRLKSFEKQNDDDEITTFKSPNKKKLTKLEQFEKNKKKILKLEMKIKNLYSKLSEEDLFSYNKKSAREID